MQGLNCLLYTSPRQNTIYQALEGIRQMDFPYFNIDLIYGIKAVSYTHLFVLLILKQLDYEHEEINCYFSSCINNVFRI